MTITGMISLIIIRQRTIGGSIINKCEFKGDRTPREILPAFTWVSGIIQSFSEKSFKINVPSGWNPLGIYMGTCNLLR
jgi:hypothetical protein